MNAVFQALSSTARRQILAYLSEAELTAGEISERFNMAKPSVSKHLNILLAAGLIEKDKRGQFIHYRLVKENLFASLNDFLVDFCPKGRPLKLESQEKAKSKEG